MNSQESKALFEDFQMAATHLSGEFSLALELNPKPGISIAMVQSSADSVQAPLTSPLEFPKPLAPEAKVEAAPLETTYPIEIEKLPEVSPVAKSDAVTVDTQAVVTQKRVAKKKQTEAPILIEAPKEEAPVVTLNQADSTGLTKEDQKKLIDSFLSEQVSSSVITKTNTPIQSGSSTARTVVSAPMAIAKSSTSPVNPDLPVIRDESAPTKIVMKTRSKIPSGPQTASAENCDLTTHSFIKPNAVVTDDKTNQINPEHNEWISKTWGCSGWIRSEYSDSIPTVTLHPAPNDGATLVLDQNSLALLAIRSGVRIAKGAGTVLGVLPDNYKVEFLGRSEDTEYFESNGRKYFAILNVEPGAGVLELEAQGNQNGNSTIFTPVFEDTVT